MTPLLTSTCVRKALRISHQTAPKVCSSPQISLSTHGMLIYSQIKKKAWIYLKSASDGVCFLPASSPPSTPLRPLLRWRAECPARRRPARTRPAATRLRTSKPPSSPTGAKITVAADCQEKLPRSGRIQQPKNLLQQCDSALHFVRRSWAEVFVCSYKVPLLAPPCFLRPDIKLNISYRPDFFFFLWLRRDVDSE